MYLHSTTGRTAGRVGTGLTLCHSIVVATSVILFSMCSSLLVFMFFTVSLMCFFFGFLYRIVARSDSKKPKKNPTPVVSIL